MIWRRAARSALNRMAGTVDRAVGSAIARTTTPTTADIAAARRRLELAARRYRLDDEALFPAPVSPGPGAYPGSRRADLAWPSAHRSLVADVDGRFEAAGRDVRARLLEGAAGGPAVVVLHGYGTGDFSLEERVWPLAVLRDRGVRVAFMTLPFHGARRSGGWVPPFPGIDPVLNVEGFRQSVSDLRATVAWLRGHHPVVGVLGMSLGAYVAALAATVAEPPDFAGLVVPLASIPDFLRTQGALGVGTEAAELRLTIDAAYRPVSPLARAPTVPGARVLVLGAEADRVTPVSHAERLAGHFRGDLVRFPGGHVLQLGLGGAMRRVLALMQAQSWL